MRSDILKTEMIRPMIKQITRIGRAAATLLTFGVSGRQWLTALLIGLLLLPAFSLPVSATVAVGRTADTNAGSFEPVNAPQWFWEKAYYTLDAKIEEWLTVRRNAALFGDDNDKKVVKTTVENGTDKPKKDKKGESAKNAAEKITAGTKKKSEDVSPTKEISSVSTDNPSINSAADKNGGDLKNSKENEKMPSLAKTAALVKNSPAAAPLMFNQLPDDEQESVYSYQNNLGSPAGQVEMDSLNQAATLRIKHRAGIANFSFDVPLAGLSGRGIDAGAGMTYNSRTWNKSCSQYDTNGNCTQNHFTYDVDQSWIAPGFSTGFGYLETRATALYYNGSIIGYRTSPVGLTGADGTRRQLFCKQFSGSICSAYETTDGSFIRISGDVNAAQANATFNAVYPNGMKTYFAGGFGSDNIRKHYPVIIQDNNGNRIQIAYKDNLTGRIDYIRDTLNRNIKFYYGTDTANNPDKLVAVTIPGLTANDEIQTVRLYYQNLTLNTQSAFSGQVTAPTIPIQILSYVYFPSTKTGFKYEYHPNYGMIKKITRYVGMTADSTATNTTGTITSDGSWAASTEYDYPSGTTAITTAPKYTKRTDDWQGRAAGVPVGETLYNAPEPTTGVDRVTTITVKDTDFDTDDVTVSYNTGDWMNGLVKETSIQRVSHSNGAKTLMAKTTYFWQPGTGGSGRKNPKLQKVETTNDAGQTKATEFEYDGYNNQTKVTEYGFAAPGSLGAILRTTDIGYETGAGWINANLLGLTKSVTTTSGGAVASKTLYEYDHNGSDASLTRRTDIDTTGTHDTFYNPGHPARSERFCPNGESSEVSPGESPESDPNGCVTIYHPGYGAASAFRGNVTKVGRMMDLTPTATMDSNRDDVSDYNYDIAGNLVSATLSCCQLKTIEYGLSFGVTGYAYPTKEIKGTSPQLTTEAVYNYNTGLMTSAKDENDQTTTYEYEPDTLRQKKVIYPNNGYVLTEYSDKLGPDPISYVRTTTTLEANKTVQSYGYFDGRGAQFRSAVQTPDGWSVSAVEYNALGRAVKSYNPFYAAAPNGGTGTKYTQVSNYDGLGRTTNVQMQDGTSVATDFNGTIVTVTDQAGKKRRQISDALGRIARVDEPNSAGSLDANGAPAQPTNYQYDGNDNLTKVIQSTLNAQGQTVIQERRFKYDALSRLTNEKQVEADATLNDAGAKGAIDPATKWTKVLKYDTRNLLTDGWDARGVHTTFGYDGINRVKTVTFSDGTPTVTYTYDQARGGFYNKGALTRVETAVGSTSLRPDTPSTATEFDYDIMGRVVSHRQSIGTQTYNLSYGYNLAGQLISETYPSGKVISTNYDTGGRLASIKNGTRAFLSSVGYLGKGNNVNGLTLGNGTSQGFAYNDRLQLTIQTLTKPGITLQQYDYGYGQIDASGNLDTSKNNGQLAKVESTIGAQKQYTQKFSYDAVGRLAQAAEYRGDTSALSYKQVFDYDNFGNLYRKNAANPASGQQTPLLYTPIEDSDISKTTNRFTANTSYDEAGNVITDNKFRNMTYGYDANGRMYKTSSTISSGQSNAVYDASGMRVAQQIDGVWQFYIYDVGGKKVAEYGGQQSQDEGGIRYIFSDWQGSTRAITGEGSVVQARMDYTAFGEEINANVGMRTTAQGFNAPNNLSEKYALTERDKATGLDHTWFRKNENRAGRWTSPDPYNGSMSLGNPQSFNRYAYAINQPTNFVDPSGLNAEAPGQACSYSGEKDSDGNLIYDGTIGSNGRCQSHAGSPVTVSAGGWGWIGIGGGPGIIPTYGDPGVTGGGGGSTLRDIVREIREMRPSRCTEGSLLNGAGIANGATNTVASFVQHNNVSGDWWKGANGKWYQGLEGRGPNGATGPRSVPIGRAAFAEGISKFTFYTGTGISAVQIYRGDVSPAKGALDIGMGYVGFRGGLPGALISGAYFIANNSDVSVPRNERMINTNTCHASDGNGYGNPR